MPNASRARRAAAGLLSLLAVLAAPPSHAQPSAGAGTGSNLGTGAASATPNPVGAPSVEEGTGASSAEGTGSALAPAGADALAEALAQVDAGSPEGAARRLHAYLAAHPEDGTTAVAYARQLGFRGDFDAAIAFLRAHLAAREAAGREDAGAALELGSLLMGLLEFEDAARLLERVPDDSGGWTVARLNLGKAYRALGRFEEARAVYQPLARGSLAVFVDAALCEIALAVDGLEEAQACLDRARTAHGPHPALDQVEALIAYLQGDFARAQQVVDGLYAQGQPGARVSVLRPLIALGRSGPEAALRSVEGLDQVSVLGERDALAAVALAAAGDLAPAAERYRAAVERNRLFADPARAAQVLFWRPEVREAFERARAAAGEAVPSGTAPGTAWTEDAPNGDSPAAGSGCCRTAARGRPPQAVGWLLLALLGLARRRPGGVRRAAVGAGAERAARPTARGARIDLPP